MKVVDAVDLVRGVDSEDETVEVLTTDDTCETAWMIRLASRSQHLQHQCHGNIIIIIILRRLDMIMLRIAFAVQR